MRRLALGLALLPCVAWPGCDPPINCGGPLLHYDRTLRLCVCNDGLTWDMEAGTCFGPDGGPVCVTTFFRDADGDGFGDRANISCSAGPGYVDNADDCDDDCTMCHAGVPEICDGHDNDCDGGVDGAAASAACGTPSRAISVVCSGGGCVITSCEAGWLDCDLSSGDGCEAERGTAAACTGCGDACGWDCESGGCNDAVGLATGVEHACVVREDGTAACWGSNEFGQLGDASTTTRLSPVTVPGLRDIRAIATGGFHTCAAARGGGAWCWGNNERGQIGDGTTTNRTSPTDTPGASEYFALSAGASHTCGLLLDGSVECWGDNSVGQHGDGTTSSGRLTIVLGVHGATAIASGVGHSCALLADATVSCWGYNADGELGDGTTTNRLAPVSVSGISGVVAIGAGYLQTCAILADGSLFCWGSNNDGLLGTGSVGGNSLVPVRAMATDVTRFAGSRERACAIRRDGTEVCWGSLVGTSPVTRGGVRDAVALGVGNEYGCVLDSNGGVACWGSNALGQLGTGGLPMMTIDAVPVTAP